jgi:hypothetical protein
MLLTNRRFRTFWYQTPLIPSLIVMNSNGRWSHPLPTHNNTHNNKHELSTFEIDAHPSSSAKEFARLHNRCSLAIKSPNNTTIARRFSIAYLQRLNSERMTTNAGTIGNVDDELGVGVRNETSDERCFGSKRDVRWTPSPDSMNVGWELKEEDERYALSQNTRRALSAVSK